MAYTIKDPDDVIDFKFDWSGHLALLVGGPDTIDTSSFALVTAGSGMAIESEANDDDSATVWLSGGYDDGKVHYVSNTIVTVGGRTMKAMRGFITKKRSVET